METNEEREMGLDNILQRILVMVDFMIVVMVMSFLNQIITKKTYIFSPHISSLPI